jgi:hypothetical protein
MQVYYFLGNFYEIDANDEIMHYSPYNGKVTSGYMFTDNGFGIRFGELYFHFHKHVSI